MKTTFSTAIGTIALMAMLTPAPAAAQQLDLRPGLTNQDFTQLTADLGPVMRFRQLGEAAPLGRGNRDVSVEVASTPHDEWTSTFPRVAARFGVSDRVDLGAWGGYNNHDDYGLAGFETRIALFSEGPRRPVTLSIRPSVTTLIGPSDFWIGSASIDVAVSRAFGLVSPYAGVATTGTMAVERTANVDLDPAMAERSVAYAGVAYRWRALSLSAEMEKGNTVTYGFRIGTRF